MTHLTLNAVNREIARLGGAERLVKGDGYFYFVDGDACEWRSSAVYVSALNDLPLREWIAEWRYLRTPA
jgi:hypothetical protein